MVQRSNFRQRITLSITGELKVPITVAEISFLPIRGTAPLLITNVLSTCGCTIPTKPDAPIMPGKTGKITVKYNMATGPIRKTLTVESNAINYESGRIALKIRGEVVEN